MHNLQHDSDRSSSIIPGEATRPLGSSVPVTQTLLRIQMPEHAVCITCETETDVSLHFSANRLTATPNQRARWKWKWDFSVVCDGVHLCAMSATCPDAVRHVWDGHSFFSCQHACTCRRTFSSFFMTVCTQGHLDFFCTWCDFIHVLSDEEEKLIETILVSTILLTGCQQRSKKRKNHDSSVGSCLVSTVLSSRTLYTGTQIYNHKVLAEQVVAEEEDLDVYKVPLSGYCSKVQQYWWWVFFWRFIFFRRARRGNIEMVKWVGKFSLLLKRLRDAWMDMLPLSVMSQEQRDSQYLADVTPENIERQKKWRTSGL